MRPYAPHRVGCRKNTLEAPMASEQPENGLGSLQKTAQNGKTVSLGLSKPGRRGKTSRGRVSRVKPTSSSTRGGTGPVWRALGAGTLPRSPLISKGRAGSLHANPFAALEGPLDPDFVGVRRNRPCGCRFRLWGDLCGSFPARGVLARFLQFSCLVKYNVSIIVQPTK